MNIFLTSDLHLGHRKLVPLRGFASVDEMNETLIERYNKIVSGPDRVYILGDIVMSKKYLELIKRLNGHKRWAALGNHDIWTLKQYAESGVEKISGVRELDGLLLSHVPCHLSSVWPRFKGNVHGHTHDRGLIPGPYVNVCVEMTDYAPISLEDVKRRLMTWLQASYQMKTFSKPYPANGRWAEIFPFTSV